MKTYRLFYGRLISYNEYINSLQWKKLRYEAKLKYGFKCEHCGSKKLQVHHNKYPQDLKDDTINNLVICCPRCHGLHHNIRTKGQKKISDYKLNKKKTIFDYVSK